MTNCYLCNTPLTDNNKSLEHIIPNALGGRLKAYILCKTCNGKMGETIDNKLVENLKFFNILTNPKRDRNTKQKIEANIDGHKIYLYGGNKITSRFMPKITEVENRKNLEFFGIFTNEKDEEVFFKNVQKYINAQSKNKQYTLDEIKALSKIKTKQPMIYNELKISINDLSLGYLKILLGFCAIKDKIQLIDSNIITFFKECNSQEIEHISTLYSPEIFKAKTYHRIYLVGKQDTKKLLGLVTIYGFCEIFMLNDNYQGENFKEGYCYDVFCGKEIDSNLEMTDLDIEKCYYTKIENATNIICDCIRRLIEEIAKESKVKLTNKEFYFKLCEMIFDKNKRNREFTIFLQNEQNMRNYINNNESLYMLYDSMYDYFTKSK